MKPIKLVILCSVLALAGCGDKNDADTAKSEGSLLDQAKEMTSSAADTAQQAAADAGAAVSETADNMQEGATAIAEQTGDALDSATSTLSDAADATAATASDVADATADAASSAMDSGMAAAGDAVDATGAAAAATGTAIAETAEESAAAVASAVTPAAGTAAPAADLVQGRSVYQAKCQACHATGAAGAPKNGDMANWAPRIAQGMDTLNKHAIEGFKGAVGYMPPKGGFTALPDDDVKAAVAFIKLHPGDWMVGTTNNGNIARISAILDGDPELVARFGYLSHDAEAKSLQAPAVGRKPFGYAVFDMETMHWGGAAKLDAPPPCWQQVQQLAPKIDGAGYTMLRLAVALSGLLPNSIEKSILPILQRYIEPKPATVYLVDATNLWCETDAVVSH